MSSVPYWYKDNLDFMRRNKQLLDRGSELMDQAVALLEEVKFWIEAQTEAGTTEMKEICKLPQTKLYIEKRNEAVSLKMRSEACIGRWAECERIRLENLRCSMQAHGVDLIPESWLEEERS